MKIRILGLIGLLLISCNKTTTTEKEIKNDPGTNKKLDDSLDGVWTDGSEPNASFAIERDSIRDVEHFTTSKFYRNGDTVSVYYPDDTLTSIMYKIHPDTLVYEAYGAKTKFWRFKN